MLDLLVCESYLGNGNSIPGKIAYIVALVVRLIQIAVPILLIIWGMLDLGKAVISQKEEEIKKGQSTFIKRLIAAAIVFFVVVIVKLLIQLVAGGSDGKSISNCITEVLNCRSVSDSDPDKCAN